MWVSEIKNKTTNTKYRFFERYKDPYSDKYKLVSVLMNSNTKKAQKEAQRRLNEKINAALSATPKAQNDATMHKVINDWFRLHVETSGLKIPTINNHRTFKNHLLKAIDTDVLLNNIDFSFLQSLILDLNKLYSEGTVKRLYNTLFNILSFADSYYQTDKAVLCDKILLPKKAKSREDIEKEEQRQNNYLEMSQVLAICDYILNAKHTNKRMALFTASIIELQALTGMRLGEVQALQVDDVDLENKLIHITGTIHWRKYENGYGYKDTTKTKGSRRTITISTRACQILKQIMLERRKSIHWIPEYEDRGFLFTTKGGNPIYSHKINRLLANAVEALNINKKVTSHTFRHTHISLLVEMGVPIKAIMQRVGHTSEKTTVQIYTHVTEKMDKQLSEKLEMLSNNHLPI